MSITNRPESSSNLRACGTVNFYRIKGSSQYNTREMSRLIDGLVSECKECGIETLTPEELERMMVQYAKKDEVTSLGV